MITLKHILVATDFSEPSAAALRYGCALAGHFTSTLHVVHAVALAPNVLTGTGAYVVSVPDLQLQIEEAARKELDELPIECDGLLPVERVVILHVAAAAIVDYAKKNALGSSSPGHTGAAPLLTRRSAVSPSASSGPRTARAHRPMSGQNSSRGAGVA